jgi:primosomal protein DnaI
MKSLNKIDKRLNHKSNLLKGKQKFQEVLNHPLMRSFIKKNPNIPREQYIGSVSQIFLCLKEHENCRKCPGLHACKNMMPGYRAKLVNNNGFLGTTSQMCPKLEQYQREKKRKELMQTYCIPKDILRANFQDIDLDPARLHAIDKVIRYYNLFQNKNIPSSGIYLYGGFGVGKSYIAGAMMNQITRFGIDCFMIYVPEFVQNMYNSIRGGTTNEIIEEVKKTQVLILDDIGAENLNPWIRDEVLGSILQHRMAEKLPTIYTSNLTLDELEQHFTYTSKGGEEKKKALRIMERIRHFVDPIFVHGENRRTTSF